MILIIQNGYVTPCISKYLDEKYYIVKSFETDVSEISPENYSMIIILGGYQSVTYLDSYSYLHNVVKLVNKCLSIKKPIFGICLGAQLVAHALGCEIRSSGKLNIGYDTKILGYDNIFRSHIDYIIPNSSIDVLEYFDNMPYVYKYKDHVYGIQCHPEISPECVQRYCDNEKVIEYSKKNSGVIHQNNEAVIRTVIQFLQKN